MTQPVTYPPGSSPRHRIREAFSPDNLRTLAHRLADVLGEHMDHVTRCEGAVLNWADPPDTVRRAGAILDTATSQNTAAAEGSDEIEPAGIQLRESLVDRFESLVREMLQRGHNLHDPRYIGHQVPAPVPIAGLFDAVGSITNQVMAIYEMGPWSTSVERALVERLGQQIGWSPDSFAGLVTHGGSLGNLTALLTARNVRLGDAWETGLSGQSATPVIVAHQDAHYSVSRAAGVVGIGVDHVLRCGLDEKRRMDPNQLDELLGQLRSKNHPIVAVSACSCATPIGAFDPLEDIAAVCHRHEVWLHVDAAHGGAACLSRKYRHLVAGLDQADSLVMDAHKMLFVPALCAFVFYRNRDHRFETFRQDAPYLFDPSAPGLAEYDSGMLTPECTKRAATYGLWGTWALFGQQLFEDMVDQTFDLGHTFYEMLTDAPDFEPLHVPECNIVAFRHIPDAMRGESEERLAQFLFELRRELIHSGEFYIVQANVGGLQALRVTIINPLTTADHLAGLLEAIRRIGRQLLTADKSARES